MSVSSNCQLTQVRIHTSLDSKHVLFIPKLDARFNDPKINGLIITTYICDIFKIVGPKVRISSNSGLEIIFFKQ